MPKTILALLIITLVIGGCKKSCIDQPAPTQPDRFHSIEGVFMGHVIFSEGGNTLETFLELSSPNKLIIANIQNDPILGNGHWQLQGTQLKGTFYHTSVDSFTIDVTWNAGARTLKGLMKDFSGQVTIGTIQLTQKDPLPIEGSYSGSMTVGNNEPPKPFAFSIKPGGVVEDDFGAVGTWKVNDDGMIIANFSPKGIQLGYLLAGFYNAGTGLLLGDWQNEKSAGRFKVIRRIN